MPVARLRGLVEEKGDSFLIVGLGGISLVALVPTSTAGLYSEGERASLFTHLHVREDALTLFGFASADELDLFEQLISVSGVGPRVALAVLSAMSVSDVASAIIAGHTEVLRRVPGVGQKTAERIVLELRDKVTPPSGMAQPAKEQRPRDGELIAALTALGYSQAEASDVAARLPGNGDRPLEDRVREALAFFSR